MLVTFSVEELYEKLMDLIKDQTIRANVEYYRKCWDHGVRTLDIWWKNPRNRTPDCYKMGEANWTEIILLKGKDFDGRVATRDGFDTVEDLIRALSQLKEMTIDEVMEKQWVIIRWKWIDGPHPRK